MNDVASRKIDLGLTGVPETLLWPLYFRAHVARQGDFLVDPLGVSLVDRIACDFSKFGRPNTAHAVRAKFGDDLVRGFLEKHPQASVVSLGEGLETQFWRVNNGAVSWISVDLPEAIAARRRLLPAEPRNTLLECSAFDPTWIDAVDATKPVFIVAAGLFMYFSREEVVQLLSTIGSRLPRSEIYFDTVPPWLSRRTQKGWRPTKNYTTPSMPFGIGIDEIASFARAVPQMRLIRVCAYPEPYPKMMPVLAFLSRIPPIRRRAPALIHAAFGTHAENTQQRLTIEN
ncbi:class I SAM-dependent methyltransferase (plasmid) [Nitrobacteraceae bacterium UC4446_H13]